MSSDLNGWFTIRFFHHGAGKDRLMRDALMPALAGLRAQGQVRAAFLQRHWLRGPHVQVNVQLADPDALPGVTDALRTAGLDWWAAHGPLEDLTADEYLRRFTSVGQAELVTEPLLPLVPGGTVTTGPLRMREEMFGGPSGAATARAFWNDTQDVLRAALDPRAQQEGRVPTFLRWAFTFAHSFEGLGEEAFCSVPSVGLTFKSHAEAYFFNGNESLRAPFEHKRLQAAGLIERLYLEAREPDRELRQLRAAFRDAYGRIMEDLAAQTLRLPTTLEYHEMEGKDARPLTETLSSWHAGLADPDSDLSRLSREPEIVARRLIVNLMYQQMITAGGRALDRLFVCHVASRTIEDAFRDQAWTAPRPRPVTPRAALAGTL